MYKEGKFKFRIEFPRGFPQIRPEVIFKTPVYHSLIDFKTGRLDLRVKIIRKKHSNLRLEIESDA